MFVYKPRTRAELNLLARIAIAELDKIRAHFDALWIRCRNTP